MANVKCFRDFANSLVLFGFGGVFSRVAWACYAKPPYMLKINYLQRFQLRTVTATVRAELVEA
jgi:hypothetical protein